MYKLNIHNEIPNKKGRHWAALPWVNCYSKSSSSDSASSKDGMIVIKMV
jgi:hypothetical protein